MYTYITLHVLLRYMHCYVYVSVLKLVQIIKNCGITMVDKYTQYKLTECNAQLHDF